MAVLAAPIVFVALVSTASAGGQPEAGEITGVVWKWQQTRYNNDTQNVPSDPSLYTIEFKSDGKLNIRADCNRAGGTYSMEGKSIRIEQTHSTMAMCPPGSLDQDFNKDLSAAAIYFFQDDFLYLDLKYDSGTMKFAR
jgi:heat shock protein HslJ